MRFRILGPIEFWSGQGWCGISAPKWRALLAALLLEAGQVVPADRLIDELWGDRPPANASNALAVYVSKLRKLIGDDTAEVLATRAPGYEVRLAPGDLDAAVFGALVAEGRRALAGGAAQRASELLAEALALWRGQALVDVPASELVAAEAERLAECRIDAAGLRMRAELACGRGAAVVADLQRLTTEHPLREELWALLMRALGAAGRHAEALETYDRARRAIAEELGVDPGAELQRLHRQILDADAGTHRPVTGQDGHPAAPAAAPGAAAARPQLAPSQLPAGIPDFTGRGEHVKYLCDLLSENPDGAERRGAVVIGVVVGQGGLGKTTLAVHTAHRLRDEFPGGQLYVDLRGASDRPVAPGDVLARFLRDLGVDAAMVPASDDERAALYRTRLAGRRMLIVLDDARDAAHVRPLLPGSASCGVLVTSRNHLPGLVARLVDLDVLDEPEARTFFARVAGAQRVEAEPEATGDVLRACAGLPLAIRIAGARLAARAGWTIETLARRLADQRRRMDEFKAGDLAVRACFEVSYASLPDATDGASGPARVFRLLGLWQGPSISLPAAAALVGEPAGQVADALEVLVDAHLLQSPSAERYRFHDLLRVYAAERAEAQDAQEDRDAAVRRIHCWFLHTAAAADRVTEPRERVALDPAPPGCTPLAFSSVDSAYQWCESERANIVAATRQAAEAGLHDVAWKLPVAAAGFLYRRTYWADLITAHRIALTSARAVRDRKGEAWVLNNLGMVFGDLRMSDAVACLKDALAIRRELGDRYGEAQAAINLAFSLQMVGRLDEVTGLLQDALVIERDLGDRYGESIALSNLGEAYLDLGRIDEAIGLLEEAAAIAREIDGRPIEGYAYTQLGRAHLDLGRMDEAVRFLQQALALHLAAGDRYGEAHDLKHIGRAEFTAGRWAEARIAWRRARAIFGELGDESRAAEIGLELDRLPVRGEAGG